MHFTIITPSFNQLEHLKRCVASVADQTAGRVEHRAQSEPSPSTTNSSTCTIHHHIQDGASTDGTVEFLKSVVNKLDVTSPNAKSPKPKAYSFSFSSEADEGMYDAINKGIEQSLDLQRTEDGEQTRSEAGAARQQRSGKPARIPAPGTRHHALGVGDNTEAQSQEPKVQSLSFDSVIAWLNCDEQYLPGTLQKVAAYFKEHPDVDILFGGMLMVDAAGELLACRKAMPMRRLFLEASYLYNYSCSMFFRESIWRKLGGFDTSFKNAGDEDLIRRAIKYGARSAVLEDYLSAFVYGGTNLSSDPSAVLEHERLKNSGSVTGRLFKLPLNLFRLLEKFARGGHVQRNPVAYELYAERLDIRSCFKSTYPSCRWPDESKPYLMSHRLSK